MKVFAVCQSYYHVAQVLALCTWMQSRGDQPQLTIFRGPFLGAVRINWGALDLTRSSFPVTLENMPHPQLGLLPWASIRFMARTLGTQARDVTLVCPNGPHLGLISGLAAAGVVADEFFSIEDGIGSHGNLLYRARALSRESRRAMMLPVYAVVEALKRAILRIATVRSGGLVETIARRPGFRQAARIDLRPQLRAVLANSFFAGAENVLPEDSVLFLSQPLVELGLIEEKAYLAVLEATREHFRKVSFPLIIKAHPAEGLEKFSEYAICGFDGPVEALVGANHRRLRGVVGFSSTGLLLARRLFALQSFRIEHSSLSKVYAAATDIRLIQLLEETTDALNLD